MTRVLVAAALLTAGAAVAQGKTTETKQGVTDEVPPLAETASPESGPSEATAPETALTEAVRPAGLASPATKLRTVVMGIVAERSDDRRLCHSLDQVVQGQVALADGREVIGQAELASLLQLEADKAALGCDADSCLAEIANALDADRVISGSLNQLGSSYFVVLTELDARDVRVVTRVQKRLSTDEDRLLGGVESMARELVFGPDTDATGGIKGTLIVTSNPPAEVFVDGESFGGSPAVIDGLEPGSVELELVNGGDRVTIEAPVVYAKATNIDAQLSITKGPTADEIQEAANDAFWAGVASLSGVLIGVPCLCCSPVSFVAGGSVAANIVGTAVRPDGTLNPFSVSFWMVGSLCGFMNLNIAALLLAMAIGTFITGPDAPDFGPPAHKILIRPPEGEGDHIQMKIDPETGDVEESSPDGADGTEGGADGSDEETEALLLPPGPLKSALGMEF